MITLVNVMIDMKYHQLLIQTLIAFLFILRPAHNSNCHHVIKEVLDWPDSDFEVSFWWCSYTNTLLVQTWRKWNKQSQSQRKQSTSTTQGWSRFWSLQVHCYQCTCSIWWEINKDKSDKWVKKISVFWWKKNCILGQHFILPLLVITVFGVLEVNSVDTLPFGSVKDVAKERWTSGRLTTSSHASIHMKLPQSWTLIFFFFY